MEQLRGRASGASEGVDLLVLCAGDEELEAFGDLAELRPSVTSWRADVVHGQRACRFGLALEPSGRGQLSALAAVCGGGGPATAIRAVQLAVQLRPSCIALLGSCPGDGGRLAAGDLVWARKVWWAEGEREGDERAVHEELEAAVVALAAERRPAAGPRLHLGELAVVESAAVGEEAWARLRRRRPGTVAWGRAAGQVVEVAERLGLPWIVVKAVHNGDAAP